MFLPWTLLFVVMTTSLPVNRRRSCGSQLADILSLVCAGRGYNTPYAFNGEQTEPSTPSKSRRMSRGITHECCKVGCSWKTMEEYCLPGETENKIFDVESLFNQIQTDDSSKVSPKEKNYDRSSPKKAKGHRKKKKKGRKGNGRCRCRRKQRKFDPEKVERMLKDSPVIEIGTVPPPYLGQPVILPRVKRSSTTSRGTFFLREQKYTIASLPHQF